MKAKCCYISGQSNPESNPERIDCPNDAEWAIYSANSGPTEACSDHVGHLLDDSGKHEVFQIDGHATGELPDA